MKINTLLGIIILSSFFLVAEESNEWIEEEMSAMIFGKIETSYTIKGKGEECQVTYVDNEVLTDTTCLALTDSKGLIIYCTKKKTICKEKIEIDTAVNPRYWKDSSSKASVVLKDWVTAHNNKDMKLLSKLYSSELTYYGKKMTRKKCIKDKKRFLKKYPDFYQKIEEVDSSEITPNLYKFTFTKIVRTKLGEDMNLYPSYLVIDGSTSSILVEGDDVTDKNIKTHKIEKVKAQNEGKKIEKKLITNNTRKLTIKEECKLAEDNFSKVYEIFGDAQLNPKETSDSTFEKQIEARDLALKFIKKCKGISRNIFWNGGYKIDDVKTFVRHTNRQERLVTDLNKIFK